MTLLWSSHFPTVLINKYTKPPVTKWSSLSCDEISNTFNDSCGEAGMLQLQIILHSKINARYIEKKWNEEKKNEDTLGSTSAVTA